MRLLLSLCYVYVACDESGLCLSGERYTLTYSYKVTIYTFLETALTVSKSDMTLDDLQTVISRLRNVNNAFYTKCTRIKHYFFGTQKGQIASKFNLLRLELSENLAVTLKIAQTPWEPNHCIETH